MPNTPPPLLGFNNNVRHQGRVFHIQTEDSGIKRPHLITHLFADGGRILKTMRTDYSEHIGCEDMRSVVRKLMKDQHKAMFVALRSGELNALIAEAFGEPEPVVEKPADEKSHGSHQGPGALPPPPPRRPSVAPARPRSMPPPLNRSSRKTPSSKGPPQVIRAAVAAAAASASPVETTSEPPAATPAAQESGYTASRPASIFGSARPAKGHSIFGDDLIGEKSLDEVILSYLADDLEAPPQD